MPQLLLMTTDTTDRRRSREARSPQQRGLPCTRPAGAPAPLRPRPSPVQAPVLWPRAEGQPLPRLPL